MKINKPYKSYWMPLRDILIFAVIVLFGAFLLWWAGGFHHAR